MMFSLKNWFQALSQREKILVSILAVLLVLTVLFYAVVMPFVSALDKAEQRYELSVARQVAIERKVALLSAPANDGKSYFTGAPDIFVSQSAGEAGFAVSRLDPQTGGRVNIVIGSAKSTALFGWLARMEADGMVAEALSVQPNENGTITATITLKAMNQN